MVRWRMWRYRFTACLLCTSLSACGGRKSEGPSASPPTSDASDGEPAAQKRIAYVETPQFQPLLELLPEGTDSFVISTQIDWLIAASDAVRIPWKAASERFASKGEKGSDLEPVFAAWEAMTTVLANPEIDASRGILIAEAQGETFVVYAASDPSTLPRLLGATVWAPEFGNAACRALEKGAPFAVCAQDSTALAKFAPGKGVGEDVRATLTERFAAEAPSAVAVAQFGRTEASDAFFLVHAGGAGLRVTLDAPVPDAKTAGSFGRGPASLLAELAPVDTFAWGRIGPDLLAVDPNSENAFEHALAGSLTGESFAGAVPGTKGVVLLAGLVTPDPLRGVLTLLGGQLPAFEAQIEPLASVALKARTVSVGGVDLPVVHAKLKDRAQVKTYAKLGIPPEAWLFAGDRFGGIAFGLDETELVALIGRGPNDPPTGGLSGVPAMLVERASADVLSIAMHWALDALQSPPMAKALLALVTSGPKESPLEGWTHGELVDLLQYVLTPFSSLTFSMSPPNTRMRVDGSLELWVDPMSEAGRNAVATFARPMAAKARTKAYRELVKREPSSPQAPIYRVRAGDDPQLAMSTAVVAGAFAAIFAASLKKYTDRVKAAAPGAAP